MPTQIEWVKNPDGTAGETWNPIRARNKGTGGVGHFCVHVSPGCEHCYAEAMQARLFKNPVRYAAQDASKVELFLDEKVLMKPLRWRKPKRVFVCSMTDLFYEGVPDEWIDKVLAAMARAHQHQFQCLTKRSARMQSYFAGGALHLPNVWLGVSVEDRARMDRIDHLRNTPAAVRFLSIEPLLEDLGEIDLTGIHWVIVGGESGSKARPMHPGWARSIRDQCVAAGVPYFFKQWGEFGPCENGEVTPCPFDWDTPPESMEWPSMDYPHLPAANEQVWRVGKRNAGRLLDGRTWNEMPMWAAILKKGEN